MNTMQTHRHSALAKLLPLILYVCAIFALPAHAAEPAGTVDAIKGAAWAQAVGDLARKLEKGTLIYQGDVIRTEKNSTVQLLFNDQTKFYLGSNTEMSINKFSDRQGEEGLATHIFKGTFRFVSGLIAKNEPKAMKVGLAVALIGIRGTNVVGEADATSATVILAEPEETAKKTSIEVSNQYGSVVIDEPGFGTEVPDAHSPPSPARRMSLETVGNIMRSLQSIQRINIPRPRMH
ncbi:MAG: FecR domain-containing protein [Sulfuritalea sp.]|nr:FecR domain-containing protein [Sulfuritalea sp.]